MSTFIKPGYIRKKSSTGGGGGGGLTPEQEALLVELEQHLTEFYANEKQWEPVMVRHEIMTNTAGDIIYYRDT